MSETQIVLIFFLATLALLVLCWLALFSLVHAKGRIIRAQKAALEAERRLRIKHDAFSRNAHHELRTPLQVILGNLEMLGMMEPAPQQAAVIAQARAGTQRLTSLVQNLLDLAAVADGTLRLSPVLGDLDMRIACLQGRFREAARGKGLGFEADCPMIGILFHCDAARIEQIMSCLLDNAIKFTARGQVRFKVGVSALPERPGWRRLEIKVEDTGIGLPEDWERMLVPFEHSERSHAAARGGLGIGLPMVAGLVELMGGQLVFERLQSGTCARVTLELPTMEALGEAADAFLR